MKLKAERLCTDLKLYQPQPATHLYWGKIGLERRLQWLHRKHASDQLAEELPSLTAQNFHRINQPRKSIKVC